MAFDSKVSDPFESHLERASAQLDAIENNKTLNAYITVTGDNARKQAEAADARREKGKTLKLDGLPVAVKDNFCTQGVRTTAGSKILSNFVPPYESFVTQRLLDAGAVMLGKTNMDEFGMGSSTENSAFGPTLNPNIRKDGARVVAGGSSGGSAAAVAGGLAAAALGTDTGGSIRQPASFCGVVGYKPTYGLCSRWGIVAYGSSLDQAGAITKDVGDAAKLMDVIIGEDPKDSTSTAWTGPDLPSSQDLSKAKKLKLGMPKQMRAKELSDDLAALWSRAEEICKEAEIELIEVDLPNLDYSLPAYYITVTSEASSNLSRYDGVRYGVREESAGSIEELYERSRTKGFRPETRRRIMTGAYCLSAGYYDEFYNKATKVRRMIFDDFRKGFGGVDAMLWPTTPSAAFELGFSDSDPTKLYLEDIFTVPVNLIGSPAISVPTMRNKDELPLGMQIVGPQMGDWTVLHAAAQFEKAAAFA